MRFLASCCRYVGRRLFYDLFRALLRCLGVRP